MKINRIHIANFGPHKDTEIDFTQPITAIIGHNGAGKTFLIEAIPACFFGVWPSRGNLAEAITKNYLGDCMISIEFEIGGQLYVAERKIHKTPKSVQQDAYLFRVNEVMAGPKVTDFESHMINLLGDGKLFFSSVFSSQGNIGDIVESRPADRKALLSQMLDITRLQDLSNGFAGKERDAFTKLNTSTENIEQLLTLLTPEIATEGLESEIFVIKKDIQYLMEQMKITEHENSFLVEKKQHYVAHKEKMDFYKKQLEILESRKASIQYQATDIVRMRDRAIELQEQDKMRDDMIAGNQEIEARNKERQDIRQKNMAVKAAISFLQNKISTIQQKMNSERAKYNYTRESLESKTKILESGNYSHDVCHRCNFVSNAIDARNELAELKEPIFDAQVNDIEQSSEQIQDYEKKLLPEEQDEKLFAIPSSNAADTMPRCKILVAYGYGPGIFYWPQSHPASHC